MKIFNTLKSWPARFDRASLRERAMLVAAAAVLMLFVFDLVLVRPGEVRSKTHKQRMEAQKIELEAVRQVVRKLSVPLERDPDAQERMQLAAVRATIAEADALLAQLDSAAPQAPGAVLREVLGATSGLELVSLKTLPVAVTFQSKPPAAAPAKPAPAPAPAVRPPRTIYRHGIEISIKGNYLALLPYLEKLQKYPGRIFWTSASLEVQGYPVAVLKLTVYTLSGQATPRLG